MKNFGQLTYHRDQKYWTYTPINELRSTITTAPNKIQGRDGYYIGWLAGKDKPVSKDLAELIEYIQNNA